MQNLIPICLSHWRWLLMASLPGTGSAVWNALARDRWEWAVLGLCASQYLVIVAFVSICSGMCFSSFGTFFRQTNPTRFWSTVGAIVSAYFLVLTGLWTGT